MYWSIHRFGRRGAGLLIVAAVVVMLAVSAARGPSSAGATSPSASELSPWAISHAGYSQEQSTEAAAFMGVKACTECHSSDGDAWEESAHSTGIKAKVKDADGAPKWRTIRDALGLEGRRITDLARCATCHYTHVIEDDEPEPKATRGVSCESCHGGAKNWIEEHDEGKTKPAAERQANLQKCEQEGMLRPTNVYGLAQNCFLCHTGPDEELVNKGGHSAGSPEFELVAWSQGEVRHHYQYSPKDNPGNREATKDRLRVLYVVGALTDLEHSLRALSEAKTADGDYANAMQTRVDEARKRLEDIQKAHPIDEVAQALAPDADNVSAAAQGFVNNHDGKDLAALDSLIPGKADYKGTVHP